MTNQKKFIVSHAPFWHDGGQISARSYHTMIAALPAVIFGLVQFGVPALAVICLSVSMAMIWELIMNTLMKRPVTIGDGNAALIGLLFGMLVPATMPWWALLVGTFVAIVIGKQVYGGIGGNPFNPALAAVAILMLSWADLFDFAEAYRNYELGIAMVYPLAVLKHFGVAAASSFDTGSLLMGKQIGGIGATFGLGLIIGGIYLILKGIIRWEISVSFIVGIFVTAMIFNGVDSAKYAGPMFHLFSGYTLIGAFFLATEDSSSPVNFIPMLIYGAGAGVMTVLIRNIGVYVDGVVFAILLMNLINPLVDNIRPKAIGKVA